jgi:hypothetical protein
MNRASRRSRQELWSWSPASMTRFLIRQSACYVILLMICTVYFTTHIHLIHRIRRETYTNELEIKTSSVISMKPLNSNQTRTENANTESTLLTGIDHALFHVTRAHRWKWEYPLPASPYIQRSGDVLPHWAYRHSFLAEPNKTAGEKSVCFVHVGKTSGSTLACYLGFRYECGKRLTLPQSNLLRYTGHLIHNWINDCPDDTDFYLFSLRDPVARIKSWFTYERPAVGAPKDFEYRSKKPLFIDCPFKTFADLVEQGLGDSNIFTNVTEICHERAWDAIRGRRHYSRHNYYNYQYYLKRIKVPRNATILAIRTEHLGADWASADRLLANDINVDRQALTFPHVNPSHSLSQADRHELSSTGMKNLCRALCFEIKAYMELFDRAANLTPQQVSQSLSLLQQSCPDQDRRASCQI